PHRKQSGRHQPPPRLGGNGTHRSKIAGTRQRARDRAVWRIKGAEVNLSRNRKTSRHPITIPRRTPHELPRHPQDGQSHLQRTRPPSRPSNTRTIAATLSTSRPPRYSLCCHSVVSRSRLRCLVSANGALLSNGTAGCKLS